MSTDVKRGRPPGSGESPYAMLQTDLKQTLKLQKSVRDILSEQVDEIKRALTESKIPIKLRLEYAESLGKIMETLLKSTQQSSKLVMDDIKEVDTTTINEQEVLASLLGGKI